MEQSWQDACTISSPVFIDTEGEEARRINVEVEHPIHGLLPFTADPNDPEEHGRTIHARALAMGPAPYVPPDPAVLLADERARMSCTPLQGRLALGEALCAQLDAYLADPETPWDVREAAKHATIWQRNSPMIAQMIGVMGLTDEQADDLFRAAAQIEV